LVVEDAAQSLGSKWKGKHSGTFGDIGSFSFSTPKIITTGQGGALVTNNDDYIEKIRQIKDFGRAKSGVDEHITLGYNFKFTDLQAVIDAVKGGRLKKVEIAVVISNKPDAFILERAKKAGLETVCIPSAKGEEREAYDRKVVAELEKRKVGLVLLIGYMRFVSPFFVEKFRNKIMNIHPSLLPAFAGGMDLNVHEEVLKRGVKVTGCTLHFVDEGADTGPIIMQACVPVGEGDTADSLKEKVQAKEGELFIKAIEKFRDGKLKVEGQNVRVLD